MNTKTTLLALGLSALLGACAHPISIAPKMDLAAAEAPVRQKSVAYVITQADRDREVTSPGGGGDKISYFPYRDLETGFFNVLNSIYARVTLLRQTSDKQELEKSKASLIFIPEVTTNSSSDGLFTWPPTEFSIVVKYTVQSGDAKPVYSNIIQGTGRATFDEFKKEFGLAGRLASEDVLKKFKEQVRSAPELK